MIAPIDPIKLTQIMGNEDIKATPFAATTGDAFSSFLDKASKALQDTSNIEMNADNLINKYTAGEASISDVMIATAKANVSVQLAVTVITSAVNTFKEITQMQI